MMKRKDKLSEKSNFSASVKDELRKRAEELSKGRESLSSLDLEKMSLDEIRIVLHELDVHEIELEIQNEELRRAHSELDRVRARYFDLYDMAPVGYCTVSEDGQIQETNLTMANLLGRTRTALTNQSIPKFIYSEDQDIYYLYRKQLIETRNPQECELRIVKEDGTLFWVTMVATAAQDEDGKPVSRVMIKDDTERKNIQYLLYASEQKYRLITENVSAVVSVYNVKKGEMTYISPSIFKLTGFTPEEAMQENMEARLTPESRVGEKEALAKGLIEFMRDPENPKNYTSEVEVICKNGNTIWIELSKRYRLNEDGDVEIVILGQNITDRILAISDTYDDMINHKIFQKH